MASSFLENGWLGPEWCLVRVKRGADRQVYELLRKHAPPATRIVDSGSFDIVHVAGIVAAQAALGEDASRLDVRALPTQQQALADASVLKRAAEWVA